MKTNLLNKCVKFFSVNLGLDRPRYETPEDILYKNRLKKSLDMPLASMPRLPRDIFGRVILSGFILLLALAPLSRALAAPFVTMDIFSGHPGEAVQISGGGFTLGEAVNIYFGSAAGTPVLTFTAAANSLFGPQAATIPLGAAQGNLAILAHGASSGLDAGNSIFIIPYSGAAITATSGGNSPGSTAKISGTGFAPSQAVNFTINGQNLGSTTTGATGAFTDANFIVPNLPAGTYQLHALGPGADAIYYFYVGGFYPAAAPATYYLLPGDTLSFNGSGWGPNENIKISQGVDPATVANITASGSGDFVNAGGYAVPISLSGGVRTFHLTGASSGGDVSVMVTVGVFNGQISPSSYYLLPGQTLNFSGNGFAPNETVNVYMNGSPSPLTSFTAGATGNFTNLGNINIPFSLAGSAPHFQVKGLSSGTSAGLDITVQGFFAAITPSVYFVTPGQTFTLAGTGFAPGETVNLKMTGGATVQATADTNGSFTAGGPFSAPFSGSSVHMAATGVLSGTAASVDITLGGLYPIITPSAYYVLAGDKINFVGSNFAPGETISITSGSSNLGSVIADSKGGFASDFFTTKFGATRNVAYTFTGANSSATASVSVTVAGLAPNASADSYYITPESVVNVQGVGFAKNETVNISVGTNTVSAIADTKGNVAPTAIVIPIGTANPAVITLTGATSGATANVPVTLAPFLAQVTPSTWWAFPGAGVTFTGSGFSGNENVTITLNGNVVGTASTTPAGLLATGKFTIPFSAGKADFTFTGTTSSATAAVSVGLGKLNPGIWLSAYYDVAGAPLTVFGGGFGPNEKVDVSFEGTIIGTAAADAGGSFTLAGNVPFGPSGNKTIQARGQSSGLSSAPITFTQPQIFVNVQLGSYAGAPGDPINFIGSGFLPNEPVQITTSRSGTTVVYTFNADATGSFSNSGYTAPAPGGPMTLTITGSHSFVSKSILYYVTGP